MVGGDGYIILFRLVIDLKVLSSNQSPIAQVLCDLIAERKQVALTISISGLGPD